MAFKDPKTGVEYTDEKCDTLHRVPSDVTTFEIENTVKKIGRYAFSQCKSLTEIMIPNTVEEIERYGFVNCGFLTEITIPGSVKKIGAGAFEGCANLKKVIIKDGVRVIEGSFDYYVGRTRHEYNRRTQFGAFSNCSLEEITIPGSVKKIEADSFVNCWDLKKIIIENGVEVIDFRAFGNCKRLEHIVKPINLKLPKDIFINNPNLKVDNKFANCWNLKKLKLPKDIFINNPKLEDDNIKKGLKLWRKMLLIILRVALGILVILGILFLLLFI